jgi:hypothetical protein
MLIKFLCDISTWMHDSKINTQIQKTLDNTKNPTSFKLGKLSRAPCSDHWMHDHWLLHLEPRGDASNHSSMHNNH